MFERHPGAARELLNHGTYFENSGMELMGLRVWGSPIQPEFNNWAFNVARGAAIRRYGKMIPENTDLLVTHGPPFGVLDKAHSSSKHLGCEELAKAIGEIKPRLHVFGHIHGSHGSSASNGTQFVNASVVNEAYSYSSIDQDIRRCFRSVQRYAILLGYSTTETFEGTAESMRKALPCLEPPLPQGRKPNFAPRSVCSGSIRSCLRFSAVVLAL